ncbi:hypothetical protein C1646_821329 [Rhizophagus diaphanus]|nr:hypothetical protein C1646_821329 [Rhizophagus diaphanus] [Rhizophagus sp. MUCL 43196]
MSHEGVILFTFDSLLTFIIINTSARMAGKEKFKIEILIGIREKKKDKKGKNKEDEDENFLDKFKIHRKEFDKYILTTDKADKKLTCAVNYYKIILVCAHLNLWICGLLKIEWCLWWAFGIYHEDQWLLLYSIPWSLLLPVVNIFTMLKESRTASRQCLFIHYFFSILQIVYCIYEFFRYMKFELTSISRIILILLLGMIFIIAVFALIIPCIAGLQLQIAGGFFEGLEELQKHLNYSPSEEYDPDHKYDFEEVYKNYEKENRWI